MTILKIKIIFLGFILMLSNPRINGDSLQSPCNDAVSCKVQFRSQFEKYLRNSLVELIEGLTTQSKILIRDLIRNLPSDEKDRCKRLEKLLINYDQALDEAFVNQNDTKKLFQIMTASRRYDNLSYTSILGLTNTAQLSKIYIKEMDKFANSVGSAWIELYDALESKDTFYYSAFKITADVKKMFGRKGLPKLEIFKNIMQQMINLLDIEVL